MPSFAMYHGLKFSYPPAPWWMNPARDVKEMDHFWNGGDILRNKPYGMAYGEGMFNAKWHFDVTNTASWWWGSHFSNLVFKGWFGELEKDEKMNYLLREKDGEIYVPAAGWHPVKTNPK